MIASTKNRESKGDVFGRQDQESESMLKGPEMDVIKVGGADAMEEGKM